MITQRLKTLFYDTRYKMFKMLDQAFRPDMEEEFKAIHKKCKKFTITSVQKMYSLYTVTKYVVEHNIPGDMVECGVFQGGSSMIVALTLKNLNDFERKLYLYDTYTGMTKPGKEDTNYRNEDVEGIWRNHQRENYNTWAYAPLEEVKKNLCSTGYPKENIKFIKGMVEETIPNVIPDKIAILRLDTDWYESTYHELLHLFPRLSMHGVMLLDDYGCLKGARKATDQYLHENNIKILLNRIDYSGRIAIKV
jgi:O-methyltransferase